MSTTTDHAHEPALAAEPTVPAAAPAGRGPGRGARGLELGERFALVGLAALLIAVFSLLPASSEIFPTTANLQIVLADQAVLLAVSLAILVPIVTNVWDFSPGATAGLAAVLAASAASSSGSIAVGVGAALLAGLAIGVVNGFLVTVAKINSVIATFGMTIVISGLVQWKTGGNSIVRDIPAGLTAFGTSNVLGVPKIALAALAFAGLAYYVLRWTPYGRYLFAIGSSRPAARLVGLRVEALTFSTFVVAGLLAGVAGALLLARTGAGNPLVGPGYTIPAYAAVFLGAVAIQPGRWNVPGVVVAIFFLGALNSGLTLSGVDPFVNDLANGAALLAGVGVANLLARQRGRTLTTS